VAAEEDIADVDRVLAGDVDAYESIVRRWQDPLINLANRFCRDRSRAEDMAQEAFIRAYKSLAGWRRQASFSSWLFALSMNVYRTELRRIPPTVSLEDAAEVTDRADQDRELDLKQTGDVVRRNLATLPEKYREALILFYFHELDISAAAKSLKIPEGTLKARLARGRDLLRRKLGQDKSFNQGKDDER
jgi:RNA polymerase sigma-70 factor (ECF subfamily)